MRSPISAFIAFIVTLVLVDIILSDPMGLPRWLSLIAGIIAGGFAAWGVYKLLDSPGQQADRAARRAAAERQSRQAWKAQQRADFEEECRKPHPPVPEMVDMATPDQDPDFETRELPAVPEPGRSPNKVDRAVDRSTSMETPADRDVRKAAEGGQSRIERFFD